GPVVAWLDSSSGVANAFVKQFVGAIWVALGSGGASGTGVSGSASAISGLALTSNGSKVALAWTQTVNSTQQIYVIENSGGTWRQLNSSASSSGISNSSGHATTPSLAYLNGSLFAAWQDDASGTGQIYAVMFNGASWAPAGIGANSGGGISVSRGPAMQPILSSNDGQLYLGWIDNEFPSAPGNGATVYVKTWNGSAFAEQVPGDASFNGVANRLGSVQVVSLAVDPNGHPFVSWSETDSGSSQIDVLGNTFNLGTIHYVNDASTSGDSFTTAPGNDANSGLSPGSPMLTLQTVLNDTVNPLKAGDVILVDNGTYTGAVDLSSVTAGVLVLGALAGASTISAPVTGTNTTGTTLADLYLSGGVTLTGTNQVSLYDDTISGTGITLSGGSAIQLVDDDIATTSTAITVSGGASGVTIDNDSISSGQQDIAITGAGATGLDVRASQLMGTGTGIALAAAASGMISGNDITASGTGISITAAFTGPISANIIHNAQTGVNYQAAAALSDNSIHDNGTGVVSSVLDTASGFGFVGTTQPNQIFDNSTGVQLNNATMQNQHVYDNASGVSGSGVLGGSDLDYANLIEANVVSVDFSGTIQYNRITRETIGIEAQSGQLIAYNLLYRNTQAAIDVDGQTAVSIVNNTLYAPTGDNVDVSGGSSEIELLNNIFWAQSGYDIYVADDSQNGYFSDYNDLYSSGTGKLVHWDIDFTDILDWQDDVAQFDLHSEGTTILNPTLNRPRFAGLSVDDFQVIGLFAGLRSSSPTINAADPITDEALTAAFQNLLTNQGFESGLTGWTASPSGGTQSTNPAPWQGNSYFFAGPNAVVTLDQTANLTASGLTDAQIDAGNQILVFGGRVR
ncbi:MAG: right-handed parallel beta-helix repeat-containing protein, partial [Thermoguttaceae bacterium]